MMASANKFLRIYYATVKAYLESLDTPPNLAYRQYSKVQTILKNNLISLLDTVFPNEKWVGILWLNFGIAAASARNPKEPQANTCVGRKHGAKFLAEKRLARFTLRQAGSHLKVAEIWKRRSCS